MTQTSFRLNAVLNYRQFIEDERRKELRGQMDRLEKLNKELEAFLTARRKSVRDLQERQRKGLLPSESLLHLYYLDRISHETLHQNQKIEDAKKKIEKKRSELVKAMQSRKILENLKRKWEDANAREQFRQERILLDDIAVLRFNRLSD